MLAVSVIFLLAQQLQFIAPVIQQPKRFTSNAELSLD